MRDARLTALLEAERDALVRVSTASTAGQALWRVHVTAVLLLGAAVAAGGMPLLSGATRRLVVATLLVAMAGAATGPLAMRRGSTRPLP